MFLLSLQISSFRDHSRILGDSNNPNARQFWRISQLIVHCLGWCHIKWPPAPCCWLSASHSCRHLAVEFLRKVRKVPVCFSWDMIWHEATGGNWRNWRNMIIGDGGWDGDFFLGGWILEDATMVYIHALVLDGLPTKRVFWGVRRWGKPGELLDKEGYQPYKFCSLFWCHFDICWYMLMMLMWFSWWWFLYNMFDFLLHLAYSSILRRIFLKGGSTSS